MLHNIGVENVLCEIKRDEAEKGMRDWGTGKGLRTVQTTTSVQIIYTKHV